MSGTTGHTLLMDKASAYLAKVYGAFSTVRKSIEPRFDVNVLCKYMYDVVAPEFECVRF